MLCSCALGRRCVHCCSFFPSADPRCDNRIGSRALAVLSRSELFSLFLRIVAIHPSIFVVVILCREGAGCYHCRGATAGTARLCESIPPASSKSICLTFCADSAAFRSHRRQHAIGVPSQRVLILKIKRFFDSSQRFNSPHWFTLNDKKLTESSVI